MWQIEAAKALKKIPTWVWLAGATGVALYVIKKGGLRGAAQGTAAAAVGAVGNAAAGAAEGIVLGIGDVFGLPRTSETACQKAMREGSTWDASRYCDASTFLGWKGRGVVQSIEDLFN